MLSKTALKITPLIQLQGKKMFKMKETYFSWAEIISIYLYLFINISSFYHL